MSFRILDTYKAYKVQERKFTGWLKETAGKLGFKSKHEEASTVRIHEIPSLVKIIVSQGLSIPENLRYVLQDVISQRKEASALYRPRGDVKADEGHAFYLQVLQEALKKFENVTSSSGAQNVVPSSGTTAPSQGDAAAATTALKNAFGLLQVERVTPAAASDSESEGERENHEQKNFAVKKSKSKKGSGKKGKGKGKGKKPKKSESTVQRPVTDIELVESQIREAFGDEEDEDDDEDDFYFMIYCFFKDFNTLREYIQERWCDYQDGLLSLSAVSVITNTAFELLQRGEQELLPKIPREMRNFQELANMLFIDVGLAHVDYDGKQTAFENDHDGMNEAIYEEADFLCIPRYWDLSEWLSHVPPKKMTVMPHYRGVPVNYHAKNCEKKMARDRQIIYEIVAECTLLKGLKNLPDFHPPVEDELTLGIIKMLATRRIPIWLVFACQMQCDIRYILEESVTKCHQQVLDMGDRVQDILGKYMEFVEEIEGPLRPAIETTYGEIDCWIAEDFTEPNRTNLHISHGESKDEQEAFYYLRRSPILCGLMIFRFSLTMNELGLDNSNQWGATIAAAHLYNCIRHEQPSFPQWLDMEALLLIHGPKRIFWRDNLPSNPNQYARSYERATGVSEMLAQRGSGNGIIKPKNIYERGIAPVSIVSMQYHDRFCFAHSKPIKTLPAVEKVLNSNAEDEIAKSLRGLRLLEDGGVLSKADDLDETKALTAHFESTGTLTTTQLLSALCTRISQETYMLNFDYFSFHTRCMHLLQAVYTNFKPQVDAKYGELEWRAGELPVVPAYGFEALDRGHGGTDGKMEWVLEKLAKSMEGIVREEGKKEILALREFWGGEGKGQGILGQGVRG